MLTVKPLFEQNQLDKGLISGNYIELNKTVPNLSKVLSKNRFKNISESGVSFDCPNINKYIDMTQRLSFKHKIVQIGTTTLPQVYGGTTVTGSPPYFFSPKNSGVDQLFINKKISKINFNVCNRQIVETNNKLDRPELNDILASQYDLEKLNDEFGIYPLKNTGVWDLHKVYGNGTQTRENFYTMSNGTNQFDWSKKGLQNALQNDGKNKSIFELNLEKKYTEIESVVFTTNETVVNGVTLKTDTGLFGPNVYYPVVLSAGTSGLTVGDVYYSVRSNTAQYSLTQTTYLWCNEFLISNTTSNPYTKQCVSKCLPSGGYPYGLTLEFNKLYSGFILLPHKMYINQNPLNAASGYVLSTKITFEDAYLSYFTFDSIQEHNKIIRQLYTDCSYQQTPVVKYVTKTAVKGNLSKPDTLKSSVVTSNLRALSPYYLVYVCTKNWQNNNAVTTASSGTLKNNELAPYIFHPIKKLNITYGAQNDVVYGTNNESMTELYDNMMKVIGNNKLRSIVEGNEIPQVSSSVFNVNDGTDIWVNENTEFDKYWYRSNDFKCGLPFLLIESGNLNFAPHDSDKFTPVISEMNAGSNTWKSLKFDVEFEPNQDFINSLNVGTQLNFEVNVVLINRRVRSIDLENNVQLVDLPIEYELSDSRVRQLLDNFIKENRSSENSKNVIQYIGGASFLEMPKVPTFGTYITQKMR